MENDSFKATLARLSLSQADAAKLLGVTSRAVSLWIAGERSIPGPVESYLRLFELLPLNLRQIEENRIRKEIKTMREGMYLIKFQSHDGYGAGSLIFENGKVYGSDTEKVRYDGTYQNNENGMVDVHLKITFPPHVRSVFGVSNPYEWSFDVVTHINPDVLSGKLMIQASIGAPIQASYEFLRALPEAA